MSYVEAKLDTIEAKLDAVENSIRRFNKENEILFILLTANERGTTLYDSLINVGDIIRGLNDEHLTDQYNRLFDGVKTFVPQCQQIRQVDYSAFLQRLGMMLYETIVQINESDIALKKSAGLQADRGIWGREGWRPTGEL